MLQFEGTLTILPEFRIYCIREVAMKARIWLWLAGGSSFLAGCQSEHTGDIISQQFVHKYGLNVSAEEWEDRSQDGQVISTLKNGVRIARSFENGQLHGPTTFTFPNSSIVEKLLVYDQGTLLKEVIHDSSGVPIREEAYEFDDRTVITLWDEKGAPLSIEEYENELLVDGKYYTPEHELEGRVENACGIRVKRDRSGSLITRDKIENGLLAERASFHPNGQIHTISRYCDYQIHGCQEKFTPSGKPLMTLHWDRGILDGIKTVYRNGCKIAEIPYAQGQKHGVELHYDDLGNLTAEIQWKNDKKHGCSRFHGEETTDSEWFFKGQAVNQKKFERLEDREKMIAELMVE